VSPAAEAPGPPRRLLVVADDLGYDPAIDQGIFEAHRRGLVTAASAMVDTPFAPAALGAAPPSLALGLHLVLPPGTGTARAEEELGRQAQRFQTLSGRPPCHLDSHRHVHAEPEVLSALLGWAGARGVRVRALHPAMRDRIRAAGAKAADHFLGDAALRPCWTTARLLAALAELPPGTSELMCHPGYAPTHARTSFGREREEELEALTDPRALMLLAARGVLRTGRL